MVGNEVMRAHDEAEEKAETTKIVINATKETFQKFQQIKRNMNEKAKEYGYEMTNRGTFTRMVRIITELRDLIGELKQMQLSTQESLGQIEEFYNIIKRYEEKWGVRIW